MKWVEHYVTIGWKCSWTTLFCLISVGEKLVWPKLICSTCPD
jgi:hypothetical protein